MSNSRRILFFGLPGSGKTTALVREAILALKDGKIVYSNIKMLWFGSLKRNTKFDNFINFLFSFFLRFGYKNRVRKIDLLDNKFEDLTEKVENCPMYNLPGVDEAMPEYDLTSLYKQLWSIQQKIKKLKAWQDVFQNGIIREHWYPKMNFHYCEDLPEACSAIVKEAQRNKDKNFVLAWDEGFIDLEHGSKVPRFITNFLNQTRKLSVDVLIASQRPVAVYPNFRALCDYMVNVKKGWFSRFKARLYYVQNSANALPDLREDAEGKDDSKHYDSWSGKDIFPYFDTRQSIGLKKIFNIK